MGYAGDAEPDTLRGDGVDPASPLPDGPTCYERLGADAFVFQPAGHHGGRSGAEATTWIGERAPR